MAIIRTLHDFLGKKLYPKTVTKAIYDKNGKRLDVILEEMKSKGNDIYSEQEIDTGKKWIDGKTIYRKCYKITDNINMDDNGIFIDTSLNSLTVETIIYSSFFVKVNEEGKIGLLGGTGVMATDEKLYISSTYPIDIISEVSVIVEYTKL